MFSSRVQEKMTTKSNFARTCNLLSQFLKERRSFGDQDAFASTSIPSPNFETKGDGNTHAARIQTKLNHADPEMKTNKQSLDLFPLTSLSSTKNMTESRELPKSREEPKKTSSMTIIYEGEVLVFEDLQEEMAREIMTLASQVSGQHNESKNNNTITTHFTHALSDLPIARRASLHRFMEKRKDRIAACAPYQPKNPSSTKALYNKQQEEHHLELKLW